MDLTSTGSARERIKTISLICHTCGTDGHVARDCNYQAETSANARPAWCGECDRQTRLVDHGSYVQRCHRCWAWPNFKGPDGRPKGTRFHQSLPQHKLCGGCRTIVYEWDNAKCGTHKPLAINAAGHRPLPKPPAALAIADQIRATINPLDHPDEDVTR